MDKASPPKFRRTTIILAALTLVVLLLTIPGSLSHVSHRGGFYVFSRAFLDDLPKRLAGPGRFRFILQPLTAIILGILGGRADARAGRLPYLYGIFSNRKLRGNLIKTGFSTIANLLLMGILLDLISQRLILGVAYPVPALIVGPVLIVEPYAVARSLSNRFARQGKMPGNPR